MKFETVNLTPRIGSEIKASKEGLLEGKHGEHIRELLEQRGGAPVPGTEPDR